VARAYEVSDIAGHAGEILRDLRQLASETDRS
jgi:hypothetical protein